MDNSKKFKEDLENLLLKYKARLYIKTIYSELDLFGDFPTKEIVVELNNSKSNALHLGKEFPRDKNNIIQDIGPM